MPKCVRPGLLTITAVVRSAPYGQKGSPGRASCRLLGSELRTILTVDSCVWARGRVVQPLVALDGHFVVTQRACHFVLTTLCDDWVVPRRVGTESLSSQADARRLGLRTNQGLVAVGGSSAYHHDIAFPRGRSLSFA